MEIDQNTYDEIAAMINCENSPVGIDAKKTHIIIIQKLMDIQKRLDQVEKKLEAKDDSV